MNLFYLINSLFICIITEGTPPTAFLLANYRPPRPSLRPRPRPRPRGYDYRDDFNARNLEITKERHKSPKPTAVRKPTGAEVSLNRLVRGHVSSRVGPNRQNPNGWQLADRQPPPTATQPLQPPTNRPTAVQSPNRHPTATQPPIKSPTAANPPNRRRLEGDCGLYDETCKGGEYPCIAGLSFSTPSHPPMP